jgi:acetoin utilization deacetylase AcuC-like enzyme
MAERMEMKSIPVFYRPEQVAPREAVAVSPSAAKPTEVVASWRQLGLPIDVRSFEPVTVDDFARVHDRDHVKGVLAGRRTNGFGNTSPEVARSLPFTTGSFVAAARHVLAHGGVAASPTSGFHHAGHGDGHGFCTFNGLCVAADTLLRAGAKRIAILDLDAHYGDGTADILEAVPALGAKVEQFTRGMPPYAGGRANVPAFLAHLPGLIEGWKSAGVDVLLYQAGADPHVDDPIGCSFLTTEELFQRDRIVLQTCARVGLPVAWNLAGGYLEDTSLPWPQSIRRVLEIHDNTLRASVEAYVR